MHRITQFFLDPRTLTVIGVAALAGFLLLGADVMRVGLVWSALVLGLLALIWLGVWGWRRWRAHRAGRALSQAMEEGSESARASASAAGAQDDVAALRERMNAAVKRIRSSRLGEASGAAALYELPWYAIIGNPAAGKSSAIVKSGLQFPFAENTHHVIQGIGGTRNCDWYFTTEGILLDTAGRYAVHEEDRDEWFGFLSLLKKHRPKAPLNGVIIAVSIAELVNQRSDFAIDLARKLRQRVQELTERLEVFVPVYVVFTKADLIAGFVDFFEDRDRSERDKVWGATLPYDPQGRQDAVVAFDAEFELLYQGLKAASVARMSVHRGEQLPPGVMTFPLEFAALKPTLRTFLNTLFEDNPYQFRPIFRGFYFTSAVQEGQSTSRASQRVAEQFQLQLQPGTAAAVYSQSGFFLRELFSRVIFADRQLVQQYTSRRKLQWRYATFISGLTLMGALMAGWTWSYLGNRQLVANVQADLQQAQQVQHNQVDLASRLEALTLIQDRLEQMQRYRTERPWSVGLGLFQGQAIEERLKEEYFHGLQVLMLQPAAQAMEAYLNDVDVPPAPEASPLVRVSTAAAPAVGAPYTAASQLDVSEAYNALKAYLMLGDRTRLEAGHMGDQLTRFWRSWLEDNRGNMPREQLVRRAERIMAFALAQMHDPQFPQLDLNLGLLDETRDRLRRVVKGLPARERVYADIKARASTRYAPVTVVRLLGDNDRDVIAGSHAVSGAFTREAWEGYVREAIRDAAHKQLQSTDWVLRTTASDDLTLEGSPEQIEKALTQLYKSEYANEWQKFLQGVSVAETSGYDAAVAQMNRLGDPASSPLATVFKAVHDQTSWDNPSQLNERLAKGQQGFLNWFKQRILGVAPAPANVNLQISLDKQAAIPTGPIGQAFVGVTRLMGSRDGVEPLFKHYLAALSQVRSRFNQMKAQGDPGPGVRQIVAQTLEGQGELAEALRLVDEQLLNGLNDNARATLRPILVRPLMQAFSASLQPAEDELNRVWQAQVYEPYRQTLAGKYPFNPQSRVEASMAEMAQIFGSEGAVARFAEQTLAGVVLRRGDALSARTWADMGVRLQPVFKAGFASWIAPLNGAPAAGRTSTAATASEPQTVFQIQPMPAAGLTEYTLDIDGQTLRYRNGAASWQPFVWPGPGTPGVTIRGVTFDGRAIELFNEPGRFGLEKMINSAQRQRLGDNAFELRWAKEGHSVAVRLRIISNAADRPETASGVSADAAPRSGGGPGALPALVAGATPEEVQP